MSGAFDKVETTKLFLKLMQLGVCKTLLAFSDDYLAPRTACVAVDGSQSLEFIPRNIVFQGTVLGPSLCHIFFADIHEPAERNGAKERRFANDFSISKLFARTISNDDVLQDLRLSQCNIHAWGVRNQVTFDPLK